jgi:hypothetical protein
MLYPPSALKVLERPKLLIPQTVIARRVVGYKTIRENANPGHIICHEPLPNL